MASYAENVSIWWRHHVMWIWMDFVTAYIRIWITWDQPLLWNILIYIFRLWTYLYLQYFMDKMYEYSLGTICIFAWYTYSYSQQACSHSLLHWKQGTPKYDGALQQNFDRKHDRNQWVKYLSTNILWDVIFHRFTQVTLWNRCWWWGLSSFVWMSLVTN